MKFGDLNEIEVWKIQRVMIITYTTFRPSSFIYAFIDQIFSLQSFLFLLKNLFKSLNMVLSHNILSVIICLLKFSVNLCNFPKFNFLTIFSLISCLTRIRGF